VENTEDPSTSFELFKSAIESYYPITNSTWLALKANLELQFVKKGEAVLREGSRDRFIRFISSGILRSFYTDIDGNIYNKNLFLEGSFAASKVSLLTETPSYFTIEALEDTTCINLSFSKYKELQENHLDLKNFYIAYIERNWIIAKEKREISLVMDDAKERYLHFLKEHPTIERRIAQHHIAAHLGVTPTQLSRIRKILKKNS